MSFFLLVHCRRMVDHLNIDFPLNHTLVSILVMRSFEHTKCRLLRLLFYYEKIIVCVGMNEMKFKVLTVVIVRQRCYEWVREHFLTLGINRTMFGINPLDQLR